MIQKEKYFTTKVRPDTNDYVVYVHKNPVTFAIFYVGIGAERRANYFCNRSPRWKAYVNKYGNPVVEIYKNNLFEHEATYLESHLIKTLGIRGYRTDGQLVNLCPGGYQINRGIKHSLEAREKMSIAHKGKKLTDKHKKNLRNTFKSGKEHPTYNRKVSDETKKKQSLAKLGKISTKGKKVINTETGEIYSSGAFVARMIGRNVTNFVASLRGVPTRPNRTVYRYL